MTRRSILFTAALAATCLHLQAQPGAGIRIGKNIELHPFAGGRIGHDSNVERLPSGQENDDSFYELLGGLDLQGEGKWGLFGWRTWYSDRSFEDHSEFDDDAWRSTCHLLLGNPDRWQLDLEQSYIRAANYTLDEPSIALRPFMGMSYSRSIVEGNAMALDRSMGLYSAMLRKQMQKLSLAIGGGYEQVKYYDNAGRNWDQTSLLGSGDYPLGEKSSLAFDIEAGNQNADSLDDDATIAAARVGMRYLLSAKTDLRGTVGYRVNDVGDAVDASTLNQSGVDYLIRGSWEVTRRTLFALSGKSTFLPSDLFNNNTKRLDQAAITVDIDFSERWGTDLSLIYRSDNYTAPIGEVTNPRQQTAAALAALIYHARHDLLGVSLSARYDAFESNFSDDYDIVTLSLGMNVRY